MLVFLKCQRVLEIDGNLLTNNTEAPDKYFFGFGIFLTVTSRDARSNPVALA